MATFNHHPDGKIIIQGLVFPIDFWQIVEPGYTLPDGHIGRLFASGVKHQLIRVGNATHDQADINDVDIAGYIDRLDDYQTVYAAYLAGAFVYNDNGDIVVVGPPSLNADKTEIANDGSDGIVISCDLGNASATDQIRWSVTAPDGSIITENDYAVAGVDTWLLTTSHVGTHIVRVETDFFGWAKIAFQGV